MPKIQLSPVFFVVLALLVLLLPLNWLLCIFASIILHESFHLAMISLLGVKVRGFQINTGGMEIHTLPMPAWKEMLCAAAGPCSCIIPLLLARAFPALALCSVVHSLYNLLPVFPLDGGRILRSLFGRYETVYKYIQNGVLVGILLLGVYLSMWLKLGILPLLAAIAVFVKATKENFLAKQTN